MRLKHLHYSITCQMSLDYKAIYIKNRKEAGAVATVTGYPGSFDEND